MGAGQYLEPNQFKILCTRGQEYWNRTESGRIFICKKLRVMDSGQNLEPKISERCHMLNV